jgi:uncharacterized membrane-anchored protein YjiN (DUF445 family)
VWTNIKQMILDDTANPHSEIKRRLFRTIYSLSNSLLNDPKVRRRLNNYIYEAATNLIISNRTTISQTIQQTISNWDEKTVVDKLEVQVGRDLQFIRINGTLVGGFVGLLLHIIADMFHIF